LRPMLRARFEVSKDSTLSIGSYKPKLQRLHYFLEPNRYT